MAHALRVLAVLAALAAPAWAQTEPDYDARVRQSFAAAETFQGALDGGWTLAAAGEGSLFAIRFADHDGQAEAAWRDLSRPGALGASGFVDSVDRDGSRLILRFAPAPGVQAIVTLTASASGAWSGELAENGRRRTVTLTKRAP